VRSSPSPVFAPAVFDAEVAEDAVAFGGGLWLPSVVLAFLGVAAEPLEHGLAVGAGLGAFGGAALLPVQLHALIPSKSNAP
jgi:hypothetical protein